MFNPSINVNTFWKMKKISSQDKDSIINKLAFDLEISNKKILTLSQKNYELKNLLSDYKLTKEKLNICEETLKSRNEELIKVIKEKDDKNSALFNKITSLETDMEKDRNIYEKDRIIYKQKMHLNNVLQLENKTYAEEKANFEKEKKLYEQKKDDEVNRYKIRQNLKFIKFKKKVDFDLEALNSNLLSANSEYISASHRLTLLQNKELYTTINQLEKRIEYLEKENDELKIKILESNNDLNIQKLIGEDLTKKIIVNKPLIKLTRNKSVINNFSSDTNLSSDNKIRTNSDYSNLIPNTFTQGVNNSQFFEKKLSNYKKIIEEKNYAIEKMVLRNTHLRNKFSTYQTKFNGLFNFLKESLNNFCNDAEIKNNQNFYINLDKIKKCDFNIFTKREKYSLLVLLMKYLLPLISINFNYSSNLGKNLFKTNLNIVNNKFNSNEKYLNDDILKSAFFDKKNKIYKNLLSPSRTKFSFSVPVLKEIQNKHFDFLDNKNRVII